MQYYRRELRRDAEADTLVLRRHCEEVIDWMVGYKRFLMLIGDTGSGKTTMLNAMCRMINALNYSNISYERRGFQWETAYTLCDWASGDPERYDEFRRCEWAAIDDMGLEASSVSNYGNIIYPLRDILLYRYENDLVTVMTSNLIPKDLARIYGERVSDRLAEVSCIVQINEKSYRR